MVKPLGVNRHPLLGYKMIPCVLAPLILAEGRDDGVVVEHRAVADHSQARSSATTTAARSRGNETYII